MGVIIYFFFNTGLSRIYCKRLREMLLSSCFMNAAGEKIQNCPCDL